MDQRDLLDVGAFSFRGLHPDIFVGTASDRYAGWVGQIYTAEAYRDRIQSRTKRIKGRAYREEVLPVDCVHEYFQHFRVLEIDYTFYRPLLNEDGKTTPSFHVLKSYRNHLLEGDFLFLKVPQIVFAQKILRKGQYAENPSYLNPEVFTRSFYAPAVELLGSHLRGFVFEQEYQRREDRTPTAELAEALEKFFDRIPRDDRYHIELRTESYFSEPYFQFLKERGIGQVLSHWTWLPTLGRQFALANHGFFNSGKQSLIRLMTPIGTRYEDAYAKAYPFQKMIDGMLQPAMVQDTARLMREGIRQGIQVNVIVNNRAGGNAPIIAQLIAERFSELQSEEANARH